jgi:Fur family ferric uptake transcriptional regulator
MAPWRVAMPATDFPQSHERVRRLSFSGQDKRCSPMPQSRLPAKSMPPQNPDGLRNIGLKATGPRLRILELFQTSGVRHMSAEDVYRQLLAERIEVGLATVYRVLTQFEQAGLLQRHHFESGRSVFELNEGSHHDHLVCLQCGRVEEFYDAEIERRQNRIAAERGFALNDHSLSLYADCVKEQCPHRAEAGAMAPLPSGD